MHGDDVQSPAIAIANFILSPSARNARVYREHRTLLHDTENRLDTHAIHPARGAGVPRPSASPDVSLGRVDIGGHDIGLDFISLDFTRRPRASQWVEHLEHLERAVAVTAPRRRERRPQRRVRILAAVFADARQ